MVKVVETVDSQVIADTTAVGGDSFVVRDARKVEEFLQAGKVVVGDADGLLVSQPLGHIFLVGIAAFGSCVFSPLNFYYIRYLPLRGGGRTCWS